MKITATLLALVLATATLAACSRAPATSANVGPAGQPSSSDVNPITGSRGGSGSSAGNH